MGNGGKKENPSKGGSLEGLIIYRYQNVNMGVYRGIWINPLGVHLSFSLTSLSLL